MGRSTRSCQIEALEERTLLSASVYTKIDGQWVSLSDDPETALLAGRHPSDIRVRTQLNADAAVTTRTDRIQPGGGLGLNLTGSGRTVGVWEAAGAHGETQIQ